MQNNIIQRALHNVKNFFITPNNVTLDAQKSGIAMRTSAGGSIDPIINLSNTLVPIQLPRIQQDVISWRNSLAEAEQAYFPYRVLMQQMYIDTINDAQVRACIEKRKNLTLLRKFSMMDINGENNEEWTEYLNKGWFRDYVNYVMDAIYYGYSLISLGDIVDNELPKLSIIRRWNISPDRLQVSSITYVPNGINFLEGDVAPWHVLVKTPSDVGVSNCGYGLLYPVAYQAILVKNNMSYNATYNELFGMPVRVLKTAASNEQERAQAEHALNQMGSAGTALLKPDDMLEFIEAKSGAAYKSYADLELRAEKKISKLILGHSDAIDSVPGKLGSQQGNETPTQIAMSEIQSKDGEFIIPYVEELLQKLREHGVGIPIDLHFDFMSDDEDEIIKKQQNEAGTALSVMAANFAKAGQKIDEDYIEEQSGIVMSKEAVEVSDNPEPTSSTPFSNKIVNVKNAADSSDIPMHPNCVCDIIDNEWVLGSSDAGPCDECQSASDAYNAMKDDNLEEANNMFNQHKGII